MTDKLPHRQAVSKALSLPVRRASILHRIVRLTLLLTALSIVVLGTLSFMVSQSLLARRTIDQIAGMADVREGLLEDAFSRARQTTALAATRTSDSLGTTLDELQAQGIAAIGMTLYGPDRSMRTSRGERSLPLFTDIPSTSLAPVVDVRNGWRAIDAYARLPDNRGYLAVRYSASETRERLFDTGTLNGAGRVSLGVERGGEVVLFDHSDAAAAVHGYSLGGATETFVRQLPLTRAVQGGEGLGRARDERGRDVFEAHRYLPSLGWGMVIEADAAKVLAGVTVLGGTVTALGAALLAFSAFLGYLLARRLTSPLAELTQKMSTLRPGHWMFAQSVRSGDEVETLDRVAADLVGRLRVTYDHLEEEVADRTRELRAQYALDRAILDTIEYGVIAIDAQGKVTEANPSALLLLKRPWEQMFGADAAACLDLVERHAKYGPDNHPVSRVLSDGKPFRSHPAAHASLVRPDGTVLPVTITIAPMVHEGTVLGAIAVFQDITEERQIDYMKSEFISLASHQLRTPLSSIRWYLELMQGEGEAKLSEEQQGYIVELQTGAARMANLIEALLHVARLEGGAIIASPIVVDLRTVVGDMMEEWSRIARSKQIQINQAKPEAPLQTLTDPTLFQIVLQNLLGNSIKYSAAGAVITVRLRRDGNQAVMEVEDNGTGIPASEQPRVFEKFFRARNVRHLDTDGSGLGLYICRAIIQKLGGTISFRSEEGHGAVFSVTLPLDTTGTGK